jgi:hypothetical protein
VAQSSFLETMGAWMAQQGGVPHAGLSPAQAWHLPEARVLVHAVPIGPHLLDWGPRDLLALAEAWEQEGWQPVQVWEDVWRRSPDALHGRLLALAGQARRIHGRQTRLARLEQPALQAFLQAHHTHVPLPAKYKYGLWQGERLVAVAGFGPVMRLKQERGQRSAELLRACSLSGCTVVGGLSKLLRGFVADRGVEHLMTYADRDWSAGKAYERLGFRLAGITPPQRFWIDPGTMARHYDGTPTQAHWLPAYNTGNLKYVWEPESAPTQIG